MTFSLVFQPRAATTPMTLPTPTRTAWDFDHTSVTWDTNVTAATWAAVQTAAATAANDPGTVGTPKYHRIEYTGADMVGSQTLNFTDPANAEGEVYILIEPTTQYTKIQGELQLSNGGRKDIKFAGWQIEPDATTHGAAAACFDITGGTTRLSIYDCRGGGHWRSLARSDFTDFIAPSAGDNSITIDSCDIRRIKQVAKMEGGKMRFSNNFITDLVDDVVFLSVQNQAPNYAYLYIVQNVVCDAWDDPADSGLHPDFVQTGHANDVSTDSYEIESAQNVVLMSTAVQHGGHGLYIQRGGSSVAIASSLESTDDFLFVTGRRGIANCDWNTTITRGFIARPPTDVPVNHQTVTEFIPSIENENPLCNGTGTFTIVNTLAGALQDSNGRGFGSYTLDITANCNLATGNNDAYDNRFPNAGFVWDTSTDSNQWHLATPNSVDMPRTRAGVRNYISSTYTPNSGSVGSPNTGWTANGFLDPATIVTASPSSSADYSVTDQASFASAMGAATSGEIIEFVAGAQDGQFTYTTAKDLTGVTLRCASGVTVDQLTLSNITGLVIDDAHFSNDNFDGSDPDHGGISDRSAVLLTNCTTTISNASINCGPSESAGKQSVSVLGKRWGGIKATNCNLTLDTVDIQRVRDAVVANSSTVVSDGVTMRKVYEDGFVGTQSNWTIRDSVAKLFEGRYGKQWTYSVVAGTDPVAGELFTNGNKVLEIGSTNTGANTINAYYNNYTKPSNGETYTSTTTGTQITISGESSVFDGIHGDFFQPFALSGSSDYAITLQRNLICRETDYTTNAIGEEQSVQGFLIQVEGSWTGWFTPFLMEHNMLSSGQPAGFKLNKIKNATVRNNTVIQPRLGFGSRFRTASGDTVAITNSVGDDAGSGAVLIDSGTGVTSTNETHVGVAEATANFPNWDVYPQGLSTFIPAAGSTVDVNGTGALTTSGSFR